MNRLLTPADWSPMRNRLILFEGIPGSGKTTTSRAVSGQIATGNRVAGWALEEAADHPFFGREVRKRHREPGYDELCLDRWARVVEACSSQVWVLEGCAFQNTVRFMFEQAWADAAIERYWSRFQQAVAPAKPALIYFRHEDPEQFVRDHTAPVRADVWEKISAHVASTPVGRQLEAEGCDTPVEFWVRYALLCDRLADRATMPVLNLDVSAGWTTVDTDILQWLEHPTQRYVRCQAPDVREPGFREARNPRRRPPLSSG